MEQFRSQFSFLLHSLRELFKPSMAELGLCIYQLESLLQDHLCSLWKHFQAQGVHTTAYATGWFLTLFTTTFDTAVAARIMDLFISEVRSRTFD